jgi:hypothetical protein
MSADVASSARMTADDEALSLRDVIRTSSVRMTADDVLTPRHPHVISPDDGGCRVIRISSAVIRRQPGHGSSPGRRLVPHIAPFSSILCCILQLCHQGLSLGAQLEPLKCQLLEATSQPLRLRETQG